MTASRWVLLEPCGGVLQVGEHHFAGQSYRSVLDRDGRDLLAPVMLDAASSGLAKTTVGVIGTVGELPMTAHVQVIRAPGTWDPVGILGILMPAEECPPPPPVVGAWRWVVGRPSMFGKPVKKAWWSRGMFKLYGMPVDPSRQAPPPVVWLDSLVDERHRFRLKYLIDQGIADGSSALRILGYEITVDGEKQGLRLAGRARIDPTDMRTLQGLVHRSPWPSPERPDDLVDLPHETLFTTGLALDHDATYVVVDLTDWSVQRLTATTWSRLEFAEPDHTLPWALLHPDDREDIADRLIALAGKQTDDQHTRVRLRSIRGTWTEVEIRARVLPLPQGGGVRHLLCRITRAAPTPVSGLAA